MLTRDFYSRRAKRRSASVWWSTKRDEGQSSRGIRKPKGGDKGDARKAPEGECSAPDDQGVGSRNVGTALERFARTDRLCAGARGGGRGGREEGMYCPIKLQATAGPAFLASVTTGLASSERPDRVEPRPVAPRTVCPPPSGLPTPALPTCNSPPPLLFFFPLSLSRTDALTPRLSRFCSFWCKPPNSLVRRFFFFFFCWIERERKE